MPTSFTCDECIEGMEWIEAYMEDPIFQVNNMDSKIFTVFQKPGGGSSLP